MFELFVWTKMSNHFTSEGNLSLRASLPPGYNPHAPPMCNGQSGYCSCSCQTHSRGLTSPGYRVLPDTLCCDKQKSRSRSRCKPLMERWPGKPLKDLVLSPIYSNHVARRVYKRRECAVLREESTTLLVTHEAGVGPNWLSLIHLGFYRALAILLN